ncbi:rho GTPase-activating protein 27 isoform X4 [Lingula anatina]|uniref:Rho GTPase-activating protein 27 isoform X4 n=1 Tax=Lingula anatina TaxID=7574 RepID=A0A1S3HGG8_LINAN|nr:rho GTPase-activating protein 27 isoform X4 [Lingula anatina]|eukprot:XP_013384119.1 rho GTPase-activating protein 27 isoform X4 [Lingula anatina]
MATGRGSHTYVLVLYDYDYVADDGSPVSIKKDEEYVLLKKANKDWWHVANLHAKANGEKPFYVPAAYVEEIYKNVISVGPGEIRETNEDVQMDATVTVNEDQVTTIKVGYDQEPEPDYPGDPPDLHPKTPKPNEDLDNNNMKDFSFQEDSDSVRVKQSPQIVRQKSAPPEVPQKPQRRYEDPTYANLEEVRVAAGMDRPLSQVSQSSDLSQDSPDSDRDYANYRPGSLSPFSTFAISPPSPSLVPNNPKKNLDYGWEEHLDETTGRTYYYNVHTRQTSWNPPRVRARIRSHSDAVFTARQRLQLNTSRDSAFSSDFSPASPVSPHSPSISPLRPSTLSSKSASLPRGWKQEVNDGGEVTFVNDGLGEKWLCSQDDQGRTYYYKEDGSESAWELPEMPKLDYERQFSNDSQPDEREFSADLDPTDQHGGSGGARRPSAPVGPGEVSQSPRQRVLMRTSTLPNHSHRPSFLHLVSSRLEESDYSHRKKGPAPQPPKPPEKRGYLKVTKIMDGNKKLKKNWSQIFIVLTGPKLFFYKDTKSAVGQQGKPDQEFEVGKMDVEWAGKEVSSKKNTIQLSCTVDLELQQYLLQQDDQGVMQEWHSDISKAIKRFRPRPAESLQHSTSFKKSATLPATLQSNESYDSVQMRPISARGRFQSSSKTSSKYIVTPDQETVDQMNFSDKKSKIRDRLLKFLKKRPTMESLQEQGILQESVFGSHLDRLCERERTTVPIFVKRCIQAIENKGLSIDGIYRVSGNLAQVQKLRCAVDQGIMSLLDQEGEYNFFESEWDIHVLTGSLKLFFRELQEPVFPFAVFDRLIAAIKGDPSKRIPMLRDIVKTLPRPNYDTLKVLFEHLNRVIGRSNENRMQVQNIAIVFGPTLMWPEKESHNMAISMMFQSNIVEVMLTEYQNIFR